MRLLPMLFVTAALIAGCGKNVKEESPSSQTDTRTSQPQPPSRPATKNPDDPVVELYGKSLTRGQLDEVVNLNIAGLRNQVAPSELEHIAQNIRAQLVDQFVGHTLLSHEADKQNIVVTMNEVDAEIAAVSNRIPPEADMQQVRKDVEARLRIQKLVALNNIPVDIDVTEDEITEYCDNNKEGLATLPESVAARHILIATSKEDDDAVRAEKRHKAEQVRKELLDGADFAKLAQKYSDCPSKEAGGDLGIFPREKMIKPFSDAAFTQEVNTIGQVVETTFGYHIIQVTEHYDAGAAPRKEIQNLLLNRKRREQDAAIRDFVEKLKSGADIKYHKALVLPSAEAIMGQ